MEPFRIYRGFTLIELLVVLAIITFVMSVVITSQSTFNKTLILESASYDIALTLRNAETYGLSSRAHTDAGFIVSKNTGYGIHFQNIPSNSFILFADTIPSVGSSGLCHTLSASQPVGGPSAQPGNCAYDTGELVQTYTLNNGITISDFCAYSDSWHCASSGTGDLTSLDIVFARPNPDVFISTNGSYSTLKKKACLTVTSPQGGFRYVSVASSGEITANASSDPSSCHE